MTYQDSIKDTETNPIAKLNSDLEVLHRQIKALEGIADENYPNLLSMCEKIELSSLIEFQSTLLEITTILKWKKAQLETLGNLCEWAKKTGLSPSLVIDKELQWIVQEAINAGTAIASTNSTK
jgi:hypothetical protein